MIWIVIKDSTGKVRYASALSDFPPGWTFRDLKRWLDLLKKHTRLGELRAYWKVTRNNDRANGRDNT